MATVGLTSLWFRSSFTGSVPENGYLLRNNQDNTFVDVTAVTNFHAGSGGNPCALMFTDYDNDGDQDVFSWNDAGGGGDNTRALLQNNEGVFANVTVASGIGGVVTNPMGVGGADINADGFNDYYVSTIGSHPLYLSQGDTTFVNSSAASGTLGPSGFLESYGWGLGFEDLNLDGYWDLFLAQEDDRDYLTYTHNGDLFAAYVHSSALAAKCDTCEQ